MPSYDKDDKPDFSTCQNGNENSKVVATTGDESPITIYESPTVLELAAVAVLGGMASRDSFDEGQATPAQRAALAVIEAKALVAELEKTKEGESNDQV